MNPVATAALILLLSSFLLGQPKTDTERPCESAKNQSELNQCFGEQFKKADTRLNVIYRQVLGFMQDNLDDAQRRANAEDVKFYDESANKLKAAEKAWIQYRDLHCDAARHEVAAGSMGPMVWAECMDSTTEDRIEELKRAYGQGELHLE